MLELKIVRTKEGSDTNEVLFQKEVPAKFLENGQTDALLEFAKSLKDELVGKVHSTSRFVFTNEDDVIYRSYFEYFNGFFNNDGSLTDGIFSDLYGVSQLDKELLEPKEEAPVVEVVDEPESNYGNNVVGTDILDDKSWYDDTLANRGVVIKPVLEAVKPRETPISATTYVHEEAREKSIVLYYVAKNDNGKIFAIQRDENNLQNYYLVELDAEYNIKPEIKIPLNNLSPSCLYIDNEFIYITSNDTASSPRNRGILFKLDGLTSSTRETNIGNGWGFDNKNDQPWHPIAVTSDDNNVYFINSKGGVIRAWKKSTIRDNWSKLGNSVAPDAYIALPNRVTHNNNSVGAIVAKDGKLIVSYTGTSNIISYDVTDLMSGSYSAFDNGLRYEKMIGMPWSKSKALRFKIVNDNALVSFGSAIYLLPATELLNLTFSTFKAVCDSTESQLSLIDVNISDSQVVIDVCDKGYVIVSNVINAYSISDATDDMKEAITNPNELLIEADEVCRNDMTDAEFNGFVWNVRRPISINFTNTEVKITSMYMLNLYCYLVGRIKGVDEEVILIDFSETPITPFQNNRYKIDVFENGGSLKTVNGNHIAITKLNHNDITDVRLYHNNPTMKKIEKIVADWDLCFTGSKTASAGSKWERVTRNLAHRWVWFMTNLAYIFSTETFFKCIDHYSYFTREIFIRTPGNKNNNTSPVLFHLDVDDPEYSKEEQIKLFNTFGLTGVEGVTNKKGRMALGILDWATSNGAAGLGGGGILGVIKGYLGTTVEDVCNYTVAHEFGHSAGYAHGSSCAYGCFTDGFARIVNKFGNQEDGVGDFICNLGKTLLRMRDLVYMDQFSKNDQMALDLIESKVWLSMHKGWWDGTELLAHVKKKVRAIEEYARAENASRAERRETITAQMDELQAHLDAFELEKGAKVNNLGRVYEPWRSIVTADERFSWITKAQWDRMNQTYGSGKPVENIRNDALKAIAGDFNTETLLNPNKNFNSGYWSRSYGFSSDTTFNVASHHNPDYGKNG